MASPWPLPVCVFSTIDYTSYPLPVMKNQRHVSDDELTQAIMGGITFKGSNLSGSSGKPKIKTIAKKKAYITGKHGSGAAKKKADIRRRRANRPSQQPK